MVRLQEGIAAQVSSHFMQDIHLNIYEVPQRRRGVNPPHWKMVQGQDKSRITGAAGASSCTEAPQSSAWLIFSGTTEARGSRLTRGSCERICQATTVHLAQTSVSHEGHTETFPDRQHLGEPLLSSPARNIRGRPSN